MNKQGVALSALDLSIVPQGGNHEIAIQRTVEIAKYLEQIGYKRIWLAEHHNMEYVASSATSVLIGHVAQQTKTIRVGSGGIMLPNHSTLAIAEQFGTLATIYPERIDLGLGRAPGTDGRTALALRGENYKSFYDFEQHILELENYFQNTDKTALVRAFPGEGVNLPFYILGSSTDSAYLSAKLGLPYAFAAHFAPQQLSRAASIYQANFQASDTLSQPYFMVCINAVLAETEEQAHFLATTVFQQFINLITQQRKALQPPVRSIAPYWTDEIKYHVQAMLACTFIGTKETVKEPLKEFINELKVNELIVNSTLYHNDDRKTSFRLVKELIEQVAE